MGLDNHMSLQAKQMLVKQVPLRNAAILRGFLVSIATALISLLLEWHLKGGAASSLSFLLTLTAQAINSLLDRLKKYILIH
jgi:hypothetical protein